ncbi:MAG: tRNA lysidine(34) synthetase TilS [Candidatus Marinimicrobia bacterium]|nr:tRNA lysidine(34) synthetase TilS [Candidatus Neomarinimicrobiota bacterium]
MKWSPLAEKIHQSLVRNALLKEKDKILLAVSGGMDSVVMLHVFMELQPRWNWELIIGHINHGLRPGQDEKESRLCRELAETKFLKYVEETINLQDPLTLLEYSKESSQNPSMESLARKSRYKTFLKWSKEFNCVAICTAHHANDQAETVLYRMLTGSGIKGLSGIPGLRGPYKRPFLSILKSEIETYSREYKLKYFDDQSNLDKKFIRNKIRHDVIPGLIKMGFDQSEKALSDSARSLEEASLALDHYVELEIKKILKLNENCVELNSKSFQTLPILVRKRILQAVYAMHLNVQQHLSEKQLEQMILFITNSDVGNKMTLFDLDLIKSRDKVIWSAEQNEKIYKSFICLPDHIEIPHSKNSLVIDLISRQSELKISDNNIAVFSTDLMKKELILRSWEKGDKMKVFGKGKEKKVSDILKDEKIDTLIKQRYPILLCENKIIWIPGVKRSNSYVVNYDKDKIIKITYKHGAGK